MRGDFLGAFSYQGEFRGASHLLGTRAASFGVAQRNKHTEKIIMKKLFAITLILITAAVFLPKAAADDHQDSKKNNKDDCKLLQEASDASLLWTLLGSIAPTNTTNFALLPGQLSQTNSTNAAVQALGNLLATNHAILFSNASSLQLSNGCHVSSDATEKQLKALRKISRLTGPKFDQAFLSFVIEETSDALKDAREAALESKNPAVRAFARQEIVALTQQLVAALEAGEAVFGGDFDDIDDD
jgi:putative membrane protein